MFVTTTSCIDQVRRMRLPSSFLLFRQRFSTMSTPIKPASSAQGSSPMSVNGKTISSRADIRAMNFGSPSSPINAVASSSKRSIADVAGSADETESKKLKVEKASVKKTIQMPGMFTKSTASSSTPRIPPALAANLTTPLPSTSVNPQSTLEIKDSFVASLPADLKELLKTEIESMSDDWFVAMRSEMVKPYFADLKRFITAEQKTKKVFPPVQDIYSWTRLCPLAGIRVVIIGQDPYHNDGQAHGLAFSVRKGIPPPPSLKNMYKEIGNEIPGFKAPKHGDLTSWAKQGVLMLNTSLTVRAHEAFSHSKKGWETFTAAVLKVIVDRLADGSGKEEGAHGVVFMAWGNPAQKVCAGISERHHHVLKSAHPSPLAASRGFFGNEHFVKCNEWLEKKYGDGKGIRWESVMDEV